MFSEVQGVPRQGCRGKIRLKSGLDSPTPFAYDPISPAPIDLLRVVKSLHAAIRYRHYPCANAVLCGFTCIFLSRSVNGGVRSRNATV